MNLCLKIDQDAAYNFFTEYDKLSPLRKEIWKISIWWVKRFPVAKPSQSKIAEKLGCCRSAVNEAFQIFKKHGWLYLTSRGFKKTKILGIPLHLQQLDLVNRQYFKRTEATYRATHNYSNYKKNTSSTGEVRIPNFSEAFKRQFSRKQLLKINFIPEPIIWASADEYKIIHSKGKIIGNPANYFVGMCINKSMKMGHVYPWREYYKALRSI